jgi:hypothetical protein
VQAAVPVLALCVEDGAHEAEVLAAVGERHDCGDRSVDSYATASIGFSVLECE